MIDDIHIKSELAATDARLLALQEDPELDDLTFLPAPDPVRDRGFIARSA